MALTGWEAKPFVVGPKDGTGTLYLMKTPRKLKLTKVGIAVDSDITASDSNYATFALTDGTTTYASASTTTSGTGDISANSLVELSISQAEVEEDTDLYLQVTTTGTSPPTVSGLVVQLEFEYMND